MYQKVQRLHGLFCQTRRNHKCPKPEPVASHTIYSLILSIDSHGVKANLNTPAAKGPWPTSKGKVKKIRRTPSEKLHPQPITSWGRFPYQRHKGSGKATLHLVFGRKRSAILLFRLVAVCRFRASLCGFTNCGQISNRAMDRIGGRSQVRSCALHHQAHAMHTPTSVPVVPWLALSSRRCEMHRMMFSRSCKMFSAYKYCTSSSS